MIIGVNLRYLVYLVLFNLLFSLLNANVLDQTTLTGVIETVTSKTIVLQSGDAYKRSVDVTITLSDNEEGSWSDLKKGDKIRLVIGLSNGIISINVINKINTTRIEKSLTEIQYVEGEVSTENDITISGNIYENALATSGQMNIVFPNKENFDYFETWVGRRGGSDTDPSYSTSFVILGDGEVLYSTPKLSVYDPPHHIYVSIKGYKAITLSTRSRTHSIRNAVYGNPIFIKLPTTISEIISPGMNERISQVTPLVWKKVEYAKGYLLELQCIRLNNGSDSTDKNRFISLSIPSNTSQYNFDADKMPKGKWRWRVHSLTSTMFLGQMEDWHFFISE